jgi:hypothetical protein
LKSKEQIISFLRNKAKKNNIEVEDLFVLIHLNDKSIIDEIQAISKKYNWAIVENCDILGTGKILEIPFATWVNHICSYLQNGIPALLEVGLKSQNEWNFAIAILEEIKTSESFTALFTILKFSNPSTDYDKLIDTIGAMNMIVSFKNKPILTRSLEIEATNYLLSLIEIFRNENAHEKYIANCLYALRGIGDETTINKINKMPLITEYAYKGAEKLTIRSIRKRLKPER